MTSHHIPLAASIAALAIVSPTVIAQRPEPLPLEARPFVGMYVPTGAQHDVFSTAALLGLQGGIRLRSFVLTSTFGWARSDDRRPGATHSIDLYQLDWGVERAIAEQSMPFSLRPFVGAGIGARMYDSHAPAARTRRTTVGFAALGLSRRVGGIDGRIEFRDHLSRYVGVTTRESARVRNDLTLALGVVKSFR